MKYKLIIPLFILIIIQLPQKVFCQTEVGGTLTANTEWSLDGSPYVLTSTLGVISGTTLTINSGVVIQGDFDLLVKGNISLNGTLEDSIVFDQTRLIFKSTDLSNSIVEYVKFENSGGVQLADESEFSQDSPKNSGTLTVTNSRFDVNTYARTKGYSTNALLVLSNCSFFESTIRGYYPRSEIIEIQNCNLVNSEVRSDSYNKGVKIHNSELYNCTFSMGCCGANFEIVNSKLTDCTGGEGGGSPVSGLYKIENSLLTNSFINLNAAQFDISNSRFVANQPGDYLLQIGNGNIHNTIFTSTSNLSAVKISGLAGYNVGGSVIFDSSTFNGFQVALEVDNFSSLTVNQCNFLNIGEFSLMNNSSKNIDATQNYWGTTDENIIANQIFDGLDDINSGIVDFSNYRSSPTANAPILTPQNVYKGLQAGGVYISWDAIEQSNLSGYKVYSKENQSDEYSLLSDVGNVTSFFTDQVSGTEYIAIKAYSNEADGQSDFLEGNESDFSESAESYFSNISLSSSNLCVGELVEVNLSSEYSFVGNELILQLSDINGSFEQPVNLDSISDLSVALSSLLPDTLQIGETYLIRIFSTELSVFSESFTIISYSIPTSTFDSESVICSGETSTVTYSGDASNDAIYNWDFDGATIISGSGQGPFELSWGTAGIHTVSLTVSENGCSSVSMNQIEVKKTPTANFSVQTQLCEGESAFVSYEGDASDRASYTWDFDGATITSGEGAGPYEISWDTYGSKTISLSVIEDSCSSSTEVEQISYNQSPTLSFEASESICYNEDFEITFTGNNYTDLSWDFDGASISSGSGPGPYSLSWSTSGRKYISLVASNNGCLKDSTIFVDIPEQPYIPEICLVTVDEESSKNILIWSYDLESVSQFGVYRETNISGEYALIEYVEGGFSNSFIDSQSSPAQQSNRYKITSIDSCGTETTLSSYHKTIHLTINKGIGNNWNLIWDGYEGFSFGTYRIYRSLDDGDFELLTEIASNLTSYTDTDVSTSNVAYQIEVVAPNSCNSNEGGRKNLNSTSRSNIAENNNVLGTNIINVQLDVYPNPASNFLNVKSQGDQLECYEITTLTGQVVQTGSLTNTETIELNDIATGIFLLKVYSEEGYSIKRIIKE